jgi:hypothetical protein
MQPSLPTKLLAISRLRNKQAGAGAWLEILAKNLLISHNYRELLNFFGRKLLLFQKKSRYLQLHFEPLLSVAA